MKIFLASTIKQPNVIKALKTFVGTFQNKLVVYIPTAANSEEGFGVWKTGSTFKIMKNLCSNMNVIELEYTTNADVQQVLQESDILFLAGGYPVYLSYWLHRRDLVSTIKSRLKKGMLLIGASAGAMVCSKTLKVSASLEEEVLTEYVPGIGLIDYEIWPHYEDKHESIIKRQYGGIRIKPLRDGEYIVINSK